MNRRGFSLVELLTVVAFLCLVVGIAVPSYQRLKDRAVAAQAIGAMHVVRNAAYAHVEATGTWPEGESAGTVPPGLSQFLPSGFSFVQPGFTLAWRHPTWEVDGVEGGAQIAQVVTRDPAVCDAVDRLLGGRKNPDLVSACNGTTGLVSLYLDN
jgi:prepilin-type N-terminal cleavage/methylation domain-containing protein